MFNVNSKISLLITVCDNDYITYVSYLAGLEILGAQDYLVDQVDLVDQLGQ